MNSIVPKFLFLILTPHLIAYSKAGPKDNHTATQNHALYEAVTGEAPEDDKTLWDQFYKKKTLIYGREPISFLKDNIKKIKKGRAFVPAMGEGRNAIFLAKNGFRVEGNDLSEVAIQKALAFAKESKVTIKANVADLTEVKIPENQYEFILVSLFFDPKIIEPLKKALTPGGSIMFYNKLDTTEDDPTFPSTKSLKELAPTTKYEPDDFTVKPGELRKYFENFDITIYREYLDQGIRVAAILAKKPLRKKNTHD